VLISVISGKNTFETASKIKTSVHAWDRRAKREFCFQRKRSENATLSDRNVAH